MATGEDGQRQRDLPRSALLREITDSAVLNLVFTSGRVTRFELAASTGISKPTISESVRRLEVAGLLRQAGERTGQRGRVATYYELAPESGWALALELNQSGLRCRAGDLAGRTTAERIYLPVAAGDVEAQRKLMVRAVRAMIRSGTAAHGPLRGAALSVAAPVDPNGHNVIAMPDSPFPEGHIALDDVRAVLDDVDLLVDNDVNFAAVAERQFGAARDAGSFAYIYIGGGIGMAIHIGEQLIRGAHGLAGEIGELGASGARRTTLARVLSELGVDAAGSSDPDRVADRLSSAPSIDIAAVQGTLAAAAGGEKVAQRRVARIADAIAQAVAATSAIVDPQKVVLGGPIGVHPSLLEPVRAAVTARWPGPLTIDSSTVGDDPALRGAAHLALTRARHALTSA